MFLDGADVFCKNSGAGRGLVGSQRDAFSERMMV